MKTYNLGDKVRVNHKNYYVHLPSKLGLIKGVATGEFRPPKKGELYISGAIPEVYQAPNDLSCPYRIAILKVVKQEIVEHYFDLPK